VIAPDSVNAGDHAGKQNRVSAKATKIRTVSWVFLLQLQTFMVE
jgi:hypothetical protein